MESTREFDKAEYYVGAFTFCCWHIVACFPLLLIAQYTSDGNDHLEEHMTWSGLIFSLASLLTLVVVTSVRIFRNWRQANLSPVRSFFEIGAWSDFVLRSFLLGLILSISSRSVVQGNFSEMICQCVLPDFVTAFAAGFSVLYVVQNIIQQWVDRRNEQIVEKGKEKFPAQMEVKIHYMGQFIATVTALILFFLIKCNASFLGSFNLKFDNFVGMFGANSAWVLAAKSCAVSILVIALFNNLTHLVFNFIPDFVGVYPGAEFVISEVGTKLSAKCMYCKLNLDGILSYLISTVIFFVAICLYVLGTSLASVVIGRFLGLVTFTSIDDFYGFIFGLILINAIGFGIKTLRDEKIFKV
ncbi:hypothetical protein L596_012682 [Steinernema carpocapsae]|uniref:Uncharacterized protein n=1 Tax=Steinernema carpocapsae TaxID=34508 RepID=A0A4U5NYP0_STECR|nr:hypothetical protein L596_012682 [Steinernema carpocapsae]